MNLRIELFPFLIQNIHLCNKNKTIMGNNITPDQALQILLDALNAQSPAAPVELAGQPLSFNEWCRRLELPRKKLDRYLRKELGCSGQEWVTALQDKMAY